MSTKRYLLAVTRNGDSLFFEIVTTSFPGATPGRRTGSNLADLRAAVARLRGVGFRPAKIRGGLDRVFRVLAGLPVEEVL